MQVIERARQGFPLSCESKSQFLRYPISGCVDTGSIAEHLRSIAAYGYKHTSTTVSSTKARPTRSLQHHAKWHQTARNGVAVFRLLDTVLTGNHRQTVFVQQGCHSLDHSKRLVSQKRLICINKQGVLRMHSFDSGSAAARMDDTNSFSDG
jgi:hypothetical protein